MDEHTDDPTVAPPAGEATGWDAAAGRWEHATLRRALVHGVRLFNDGAYHAAHDCFEDEWYNYGAGSVESSFLHGMTQVAAGVHKWVALGDRAGLESLFRSALAYLARVPAEFYGLEVAAVRSRLERALADATAVEGWHLALDGRVERADAADHAYAASLE